MDVLDVICHEPLDPKGDIPLYRQLEDRILQVIASHVIEENEPLPPELTICERLGLSRATVRRCFEDLVKDGYVQRKRGRGTFVSPIESGSDVNVSMSFTSRMKRLGKNSTSKVLGLRELEAAGPVAKALRLRKGTPVWEVRRVRLINSTPCEYHRAYVPKRLCPDLRASDLTGSLYAKIAQSSGTLPCSYDELYECIKLDRKEANLLQLPEGTAAFRAFRTTIDTYGLPFETSIITYPAAHIKLHAHATRDTTTLTVVYP